MLQKEHVIIDQNNNVSQQKSGNRWFNKECGQKVGEIIEKQNAIITNLEVITT